MIGHANGNAIQPGAEVIRDVWRLPERQREGTGPEALAQGGCQRRDIAGDRRQLIHAGDMHDQGVVGGALLGAEYLVDGRGDPCALAPKP